MKYDYKTMVVQFKIDVIPGFKRPMAAEIDLPPLWTRGKSI
jgi:hypothetical protein